MLHDRGVAYDEALAERVRKAMPRDAGEVTEKKMFGGLAFLLEGRMVVGVVRDELMARIGPDATTKALTRKHVREMDFTGRASRTSVFVEPAGVKGVALRSWINAAVAFTLSEL
jgi:hypothetical protein